MERLDGAARDRIDKLDDDDLTFITQQVSDLVDFIVETCGDKITDKDAQWLIKQYCE